MAARAPAVSVSPDVPFERAVPIGVELGPEGRAHARIWAPRCSRVELVVDGASDPRELAYVLPRDPSSPESGYFAGDIPLAWAGMRYWLRLDGERLVPDPASRFQPDGPHGASEIVDPSTFRWTDDEWEGLRRASQVMYEIHVGTFTPQGTWWAATAELPRLATLGITAIEIMPIADFPGRFGWGYDGVCLFAPTRLYGTPDDFRSFVDAAHALGIGVILDVVYNHVGPDGNYFRELSDSYFTPRHPAQWGDPLNFDGEGSAPVRELCAENAAYWAREFHVDGFRLDATQNLFDASPQHVVASIVRRARQAAAPRHILIVAENEPQDTKLVRRDGVDAMWNDDFHHTALVALTGRREAYYTDYLGTPQELVSVAKHGFLYQGQRYAWQHKPRGTSTRGLAHERFVSFLENHDQVANSARGARLADLTSPGRHRAMTALLLLGPWTPLLFQGQEHGTRTRFVFFADHSPELATLVARGRREFLSQFPSLASSQAQETVPGPADLKVFEECRLDPRERDTAHAREMLALHRDLLELRRSEAAFGSHDAHSVDGAVLGPNALVLRFFHGEPEQERALVVNLGVELRLDSVPEPLVAPPSGSAPWEVHWSSEDQRYGGVGIAPFETEAGLIVPGEAAVVLRPAPAETRR